MNVTVQQMNGTVNRTVNKTVNNKSTHSSFNLMTKNTTLGIFLAVVMFCGSVPLGYSEPLRVQLEQGIETNQIQCDNSDHVLVQRTNGKLACVSEGTAEKMSWEIVETAGSFQDESNSLDYDADVVTEIRPMMLTANSNNNPNSLENLDQTWGVTPFTSLQFPDTVNVGEEFEIISNWQYFELNEDDEVDVLYSLEDNWLNYVPFIVGFGNDFGVGVEFLSADGYHLTTYALGPDTIDYVYETQFPFQNTEIHNESLKFKINAVHDFPYNIISFTTDFYEEYVIFVTDNGDGTFSLSTDGLNGNSLDTLMIEAFSKESQTERYDKVIVEGFRYEPQFVCEEDPVCVELRKQSEKQTTPYPAREHWDTLADFVELENPDDVVVFLRESNMTDAVIDEFLELYPELDTRLKTQSFHSPLSFILPQAFADSHPSKVYVHGSFTILDKNNRDVVPVGAMVCAVDKTSSDTSTTVTYEKLQYQGADACKTLGSTGSFGFFTDNKDSNRSISPADLGVALYLDSEVVEVTGILFGIYSTPSQFFNNFSGGRFLGFGTTNVISTSLTNTSVSDITKAFTLYQYVTDANKFVENKFNKNIDKVTLRYQDSGSDRVNFRATDHNADTSVLRIGFHLVPYVYPTQHEYGHHFMNSIYKSNGGVMLESDASCQGHRIFLPEEDPKCVWKEGFAAFFPFMINEVGQLTREVYTDDETGVTNTVIYDVENRKVTYTNGRSTDFYTSGLNVEGNVAGALYDIVDGIGESNTGGDSEKYDDLNSLYSQFFNAFDTRPSTSDRTMPQQSWTEFKKDWNSENTEELERVMYLNTLSNSYTPSGIIVPPDTSYNHFFTDDFESGNLNKWIGTTDDDEYWHIVNPSTNNNAIPIPTFPSSNHVIVSEDCDNYCTLTLKDSIDMTKFKEAKLQLYRLVDGSLETGEGIIIQVSTDGGTDWTDLVSYLSQQLRTIHGTVMTRQSRTYHLIVT